MNKYEVAYNFFNRNGDQSQKRVGAQTIKGVVGKMKRHFDNGNRLHNICGVSPNLVSYDFEQHGEQFVRMFK